ncbi:hypothetical protein BGZ96_005876 [Linnemannia gamsii]|uniref:Uncharacterized protein n=1 Tax=Linnemannia gamsii TaxID=64522 RepID=A0ABQ7KEF4_9FUNG|nr:hypothetical protein BGZ96_005876 [Linnemannia gamsii]
MYSLAPQNLDSSVNSSRIADNIVGELDMQLEPLLDKHHRPAIQLESIRDAVPFESSSLAIHIPGLGTTPEPSTLGIPTKWYFYKASRQPGEGLDLNAIDE